jgi:preprotein translocase subunit SecA
MLAQLLSEYKLSYQILNAKPENVRRESEIVAQAGQKYDHDCNKYGRKRY